MTAKQLLHEAAKRLEAAGVEGATRDARWLLAHVLEIDPGALVSRLDQELQPEQATAFEAAIQAREARQPVSQIIGLREFWGRGFQVNPDVLDPRADTETLISAALSDKFETVLDLGTGSGAILVTLLAERTEAHGVGTDVLPKALEVAGANAERHDVSDRAKLQLSNWFEAVEGQFDLIVSNPPYIAADEMEDLQPEVRLWEPRLALTDEGDGLSAYRVITAHAMKHLHTGGRLIVEIGFSQGPDVMALFDQAGFQNISLETDLGGRDRAVTGQKA